jgi:hypothetical protein
MKFLNIFLNSVCESEYFKSSGAVLYFLKQNEREIFDLKIKELNSLHSPSCVEDLSTLNGVVELYLDSNEKHYSNINNYYNLQGQLMERVNITLHKFLSHIKSAAHNLDNLHKDFYSLYTLNKKVYMKEEINKNFKELSKYFKDWKRILHNQSSIVKTNIKDFFKQIIYENNAYMEVIKERDEINSKFHNDLMRLNTKKEKLWSQLDINRWELNLEIRHDKDRLTTDKQHAFEQMCYKETYLLKHLQYRLGYMNKMSLDELKRVINSQCGKYRTNFKQFIESFYPTITEV